MPDSTTIKEFEWMSEQEAKPEYTEWKALLTKHLGLKGIAYVLTQADTTRYRPHSPGDEPANAADRREWLKLEASYRKELRNFHAAFDQAIGVLRASLKYGSKAYNDVEAALSTITQGILEEDWTPELRFRAAYTMLNERYCPKDSTDVNTLRRAIQEITDVNSGGFNKYSAEFTRIHLIRKELRNFHAAFDQAIGVLRASLKYGSKAYNDVEAALSTITQGILEEDWTPELRFRAAYTMLNERYCPKDSTDVNTLRRAIQEITDVNSGGFNKYSAEFTRIHLILKDTPFPPTATELAEWARKSILNMEVKKHLTATVFRDLVPPTYEVIFQEVRTFLKNMGEECDPYCTTKSSPTSKPLVAARIDLDKSKPVTCTRCWRQGHNWRDCKAKTCSSCGKAIDGQKICPNWMNHTVSGTNWAPKHLAKPPLSSPTAPTAPQIPIQAVTPSPTGNSISDEIKRTRKALSALIRQAKKQKTDG